MKRILMICCMVMLSLCSTSCMKEKDKDKGGVPQIVQVKSICKLATLECYYHNVAKSVKTKGEGIEHWLEKDREFWIEYTGVAKIGVDVNKITMKLDGDTITIEMPQAELISINVDDTTLNENAYVFSADGWNSNEITAEDQTKAIENAQNEMAENVKNNEELLRSARERAQQLIENYIRQMGEIANVDYKIKWVHTDK